MGGGASPWSLLVSYATEVCINKRSEVHVGKKKIEVYVIVKMNITLCYGMLVILSNIDCTPSPRTQPKIRQ